MPPGRFGRGPRRRKKDYTIPDDPPDYQPTDYEKRLMMAKKDVVIGGLTIRDAAEIHNLRPTTLCDHLTGKHKRVGRGGKTFFDYIEEWAIVKWIKMMVALAFPCERTDVIEAAKEAVKNDPKRKWFCKTDGE